MQKQILTYQALLQENCTYKNLLPSYIVLMIVTSEILSCNFVGQAYIIMMDKAVDAILDTLCLSVLKTALFY